MKLGGRRLVARRHSGVDAGVCGDGYRQFRPGVAGSCLALACGRRRGGGGRHIENIDELMKKKFGWLRAFRKSVYAPKGKDTVGALKKQPTSVLNAEQPPSEVAPARAALYYYKRSKRSAIAEANPEAAPAELVQMMEQAFEALSEEERAPFEEKAAADLTRREERR
ncbi:hypothetical protein EMIHUDRAFT_252581 [Emiliania huxleyi CCMP1516]|uniref:HMG box domain-containing protein n=2 Tax=Emiliania huxleyi TaxID=2903 RepID=A0A0D3KIW9_EMIH1|nr:hypothetical protein EMIHUDRAFT_252581 [Emiliania huxleyi CCMP1516]EOD35704.1 hypothetical protein EMIHUDRAFT_252581 [Emiliania huxleyi CCMP1516]|eukprot:XP_005788133.1 hypothetical protein EMIHUDRAFT_252581 [Emiliania huxleyi CCMP1516]